MLQLDKKQTSHKTQLCASAAHSAASNTAADPARCRRRARRTKAETIVVISAPRGKLRITFCVRLTCMDSTSNNISDAAVTVMHVVTVVVEPVVVVVVTVPVHNPQLSFLTSFWNPGPQFLAFTVLQSPSGVQGPQTQH